MLEFLAFVLGASIHIFLIVLLARKRKAGLADRLVLAALCSSGSWQVTSAITLPTLDWVSSRWADPLKLLGLAGLALAVAFMIHLGLRWANVSGWFALPAYLAAPAMWWCLKADYALVYWDWWLCASLGLTAALCLYTSQRQREKHERWLFRVLAAALLAIVAAAAGRSSDWVALASVAPGASLTYFIYRYNFLNLLISRRVVFALKVGGAFDVYLLFVWVVALRVSGTEGSLEIVGPILIVICAAGFVWVPVYGWINRFLSKRMQLYADFSKRLIEEAARILDLRERLRFLAEELGNTTKLRKVLLVIPDDLDVRGEFGAQPVAPDPGLIRQTAELVRSSRADMIRRDQTEDPVLESLLARLDFNYLFPLRYEDRLTGLLFLDTSPRIFLDENEAILLGLTGQISHSIATCRAIEAKIGLERTLARQEHLASLGKVAATIAHEIKNPLSSIKTLAQLMQEDAEVASRYKRDLGYMIGETDRLNRSVQQLLSFSRPLPEQQQELNLTELLETMAQFLARQCASDRIDIRSNIAPEMRLTRANPEAIRQIVLNLMLNAIQASPPGGAVCLDVKPADGQFLITVSDCGPGVPADIRERVFEPFFTTKQKGTGLGLAIVRKNVRHLGGEIRLESPIMEGRGTRMSVTLPAQ